MCGGFIFKLQDANMVFLGNEHFSGSFQGFFPELPDSHFIEDLLTPAADYHNDCYYYYYCYYYYCYHYYTLNILTGLNLLCSDSKEKNKKRRYFLISCWYFLSLKQICNCRSPNQWYIFHILNKRDIFFRS